MTPLRFDDFISTDTLFKSNIISDTFLIDTDINTDENIYNYRVEVFSNLPLSDTIPIDISSHASSVRLELNGSQNSICLLYTSPSPRD